MKLKHQYVMAMSGFLLLAFGGGWMGLATYLNIPPISVISAIGLIFAGLGLAITIKMLSTIKKVEILIDDE